MVVSLVVRSGVPLRVAEKCDPPRFEQPNLHRPLQMKSPKYARSFCNRGLSDQISGFHPSLDLFKLQRVDLQDGWALEEQVNQALGTRACVCVCVLFEGPFFELVEGETRRQPMTFGLPLLL